MATNIEYSVILFLLILTNISSSPSLISSDHYIPHPHTLLPPATYSSNSTHTPPLLSAFLHSSNSTHTPPAASLLSASPPPHTHSSHRLTTVRISTSTHTPLRRTTIRISVVSIICGLCTFEFDPKTQDLEICGQIRMFKGLDLEIVEASLLDLLKPQGTVLKGHFCTSDPWHVSFSYARALQNTCLKTWGGRPENVKAAQDALLIRAKANSEAQLGKYTGEGEADEAKKGMFVKGYTY